MTVWCATFGDVRRRTVADLCQLLSDVAASNLLITQRESVSNIDDLRETLVAINDVLDTSTLSYATRQELKDFKTEVEEQLRILVAEHEHGSRAA